MTPAHAVRRARALLESVRSPGAASARIADASVWVAVRRLDLSDPGRIALALGRRRTSLDADVAAGDWVPAWADRAEREIVGEIGPANEHKPVYPTWADDDAEAR